MTFELPIDAKSRSNARMPWQAVHRKTKKERETTRIVCGKLAGSPLPAMVSLTRVSHRSLDDDNLRDALKAVRDELAAILGLPNDRDPRVRWSYGQATGQPCVLVEVIGKHDFAGRLDRGCETCGLADRDPIHGWGTVPEGDGPFDAGWNPLGKKYTQG